MSLKTLQINGSILDITLPSPTETVVGMAVSLGKIGEKTHKGWALKAEMVNDAYKTAADNFLKLGHGKAPILGVGKEAIEKNSDILASFKLSRAGLANADIQIENLASNYSVSAEWYWDPDKSYWEGPNGTKGTIIEGLNGGQLMENTGEIVPKTSDVTLYPFVTSFGDTALLDLSKSSPNYRSAKILAATNAKAMTLSSQMNLVQDALASKYGKEAWAMRIYHNRVIFQKEYKDDTLYESGYDIDENGRVKFDEAIELNSADLISLDNMTRTDGGESYPASAYAYVPDAEKPSTWKIRLWESSSKKITRVQLGHSVAAMGKGFRGNKADIPANARGAVLAKIKAAYRRLGVSSKDWPDELKNEGVLLEKEVSVMGKEIEVLTLPENLEDFKSILEKARTDALNEAQSKSTLDALIAEAKTESVNQYKESEEFKKIVADAKNAGIEAYKTARTRFDQLHAESAYNDDEVEGVMSKLLAGEMNFDQELLSRKNTKLEAEMAKLKAGLPASNTSGLNDEDKDKKKDEETVIRF